MLRTLLAIDLPGMSFGSTRLRPGAGESIAPAKNPITEDV